jgi:hypothetical protein
MSWALCLIVFYQTDQTACTGPKDLLRAFWNFQIFMEFSRTTLSLKTCLESSNIDSRGFAAAEISFCRSKKFLEQCYYFLDGFSWLRVVLEKNLNMSRTIWKWDIQYEYGFKNSLYCLLPQQQHKTSGYIILLSLGGGVWVLRVIHRSHS